MNNNHERNSSPRPESEEMTDEEREKSQRALSRKAQKIDRILRSAGGHDEDLEPDIPDPTITGDFPLPDNRPLIVGYA